MEQLINAATPYYYAMLGFLIFGIAIICTSIVIFIILDMTTGKESLIMFILGVLLFIPGLHFGNIFDKYKNIKEEVKVIIALLVIGAILLASGVHCKNIYSKSNDQTKSIAKSVIAKEYPDATEFYWNLDIGSFTNNGTEYKIKYQKTVSNEEKLIITVKDEQSKNKNAKMLDIPKKKSK